MLLKKTTALLWALCSIHSLMLTAQTTYVYPFLELSSSARLSALGGLQPAAPDADLGMTAQNPALYQPQLSGQVQASHSLYLADVGHGYVGYAHQLGKNDTTQRHTWVLGGGVQYVSYGNFTQTDELGNATGTFKAGDVAAHVGGAWQKGNWSVGGAVKVISSSLESYHSLGIAADVGATYHLPEQNYTFALVARNMGRQLSTYAGTREPLPFDLQAAISHRFKYLPFRLSVVAHSLTRRNLRYPRADPNAIIVLGQDEPKEKSYFVDKLFQHLNLNAEMYIGKVLNIRAGYNHQRKQAMAINNFRTLSGFSFGGGLRIRRFALDYARSIYYPTAGENHFSVSFLF